MTDPNRHLRTGIRAPWPKGKPRNPPLAEWDKLRVQLGLAGISQAEIARAAGVNRSTVGRWMGSRSPTIAVVRKLRRLLS